jgi:hypothetical protein
MHQWCGSLLVPTFAAHQLASWLVVPCTADSVGRLLDCGPALLVQRTDTRRSRVLLNQAHPHWDQKFDFAMVSAGSQLSLVVLDSVTFWESLTTLSARKQVRATAMGALRVQHSTDTPPPLNPNCCSHSVVFVQFEPTRMMAWPCVLT